MAREIRVGDIVRYQGHTWEVATRHTFEGDTVASLRLDRSVSGAIIGMGALETDVELVGEQPELLGDGA